MNLLFLEGDMSRPGGTERMTAWLSGRLAESHTVHILSLQQKKQALFYVLHPAVFHSVLPESSLLKKIRDIRSYIKSHQIDCVINVDAGMGYIGILSAVHTKAKVITWEHSNFFNNWNSRWFPAIRRFAAHYSSAVVVLTERDKANYLGHIRRCVPVAVIPNPSKKISGICYDSTSKTLLSAGILGKIKRFELAVSVGKIVFDRHPDWQWIICGDGPERASLESAAADAGLADHIRLIGAVSDMDRVYRSAAVYIMTSEMEGLPMVLLEAKSHKLPLVSFDIETGPSDIIRNEINGYLIPSGNTEDMAAHICTLIEHPEIRQNFSEHASLDMKKFDEERILEQWEQLINSL